MSNKIIATAAVHRRIIAYTYEHEGTSYRIETPKTDLNQGVTDGEEVYILLAVMPMDDTKTHTIEELE